jgi:hypothetical protein
MSATLIDSPARQAGYLYQENFLSPATCDALIDFFGRHIGELGRTDRVAMFSGRVIRYRDIPMGILDELWARRLMNAIRFAVCRRVGEFFEVEMVFPEETQLVLWEVGMEQPFHLDLTRSTTTYAAVIYLNHDFEGGETVLADTATIRPKAGALLAFEGSRLEHAVSAVRSGRRLTMPLWFTDDISAIEL